MKSDIDIMANFPGFMTIQDYMEKERISRNTVYYRIKKGYVETKYILGRTLVKEK